MIWGVMRGAFLIAEAQRWGGVHMNELGDVRGPFLTAAPRWGSL